MATQAQQFQNLSQLCEDLQGIQLVESSPNSVPQATFVRLPNETCFDHNLYSHTDSSAVSNLTEIRKLEQFHELLETSMSKFYSRRSIISAISKYIKNRQYDPQAASRIATAQAQPLIELLNQTIDTIMKSTEYLATLFNNSQLWGTGSYSEELIYAICVLIFKLFVLNKLSQAKNSIKNDLIGLAQLSGGGASFMNNSIKSFFGTPDVIENQMIESFRKTNQQNLVYVTSIFYRFIKNAIQSQYSVIHDQKYVLLVSLAFLMKISPSSIPPAEVPSIKVFYDTCPYIPLYHEYSINIINYLSPLSLFKQPGCTFFPQPADPTKLIQTLRTKFSDVSSKLHHQSTSSAPIKIDPKNPEANNVLVDAISEAIKLIGYTNNILREQYAAKLDKPPDEPKDMKPYERAVRAGYSQAELKAMLQLVALCRELNDLIRMNTPNIYPKACSIISQSFQNFIKNILEKTVFRARRKKKYVRKVIEQIRAIAADFQPGENQQIPLKKTDLFKHEIQMKLAPPSPQLIELVRVHIEHMISPESRLIQPSKKMLKKYPAFHDTDLKRLQSFVASSANWISILSFEQTLTAASDQSPFYFKEVQLDINGAVQFPVTSSLPFILCQYALDNYVQPELTEIIFYPLSIYDDAAFVAVHQHKSRLMLEEIRAEAKVCLDTLSTLIGEFTFNAFRTFAALRQLPDKVVSHLKALHARHWPHSQAYRLRTLLQQNQYYLLSRQIALKTLIAHAVASELNGAVAQLYTLSKNYGVVASIAISRVLNIIRETHRLLSEQGLCLIPFKDINSNAKNDNMLQGFASEYLELVTSHLVGVLVRKYALSVNPLRFVPPKKIQLPAETLGGKSPIGKILKDALDVTVSFITVHHFQIMMRQINDGSTVYLVSRMKDCMTKAYSLFIGKYSLISERLIRIKDAPFGTSAHAAFSRYESAYRFFLNDPSIEIILREMQTLGNLVIVAELMDEALSTKEFNVVQIMSYIRSVDDKNTPRDEIEQLFENEFRDAIKMITARPMSIAEDSQQLTINMTINTFGTLLRRDFAFFEEPNQREMDFTQLRGFASVWSVIEFVYCLNESLRVGDTSSGFAKFGQGVMICAAIILLFTGQTAMSKVLDIGRRILRHHETDMSGMSDEKTLRYIACSAYGSATVDWALNFLQPHVQNFMKTNY